MKPVTPRQIMKLLLAHGWVLKHTTGSHFIFTHPDNPLVIPVPDHNRDLKQGTQLSIMRIAGIYRDEL